ncbi:MerR family transcriptional regulator [Kitasatospora sp. A2-31]|uniref:DNA polymerase III subunit beta family protein n=1 Tax=Kitasatospora sp. A2-31 TaxID=2916414 RepID=UPI001EEA4193|nr:MerR family transcriptional regulator [Kitasatospora sp. A2-31]MCG6497164.1 MerR family transcriptional regulator [Kitasatospora sp. A2-31]
MESDLRSIGELARDSGLGVSALRFYDGAGVLSPARVDPRTGYRWYGPGQLADARLLCRLRRVGLPLAGIRAVLGADPGSGVAHRVVDAHLRRLEDGLADARRELSLIRDLIDQRENPMTAAPTTAHDLTVPARELAEALDAVRFAVSGEPELPMLAGVLFDLDGGLLRLVATDRYRMALAELPVPGGRSAGASVAAIVPTALVDALRALLGSGGDQVRLALGDGLVRAETGGHRIEGAALDHDYPDYRSLVRLDPVHRVGVPAADLREAVESGATRTLPSGPHGTACEATVLAFDPDGRLTVAGEGAEPAPGGVRVAVNRDFLLDAVRAGGPEQLVLEVGGPIAPLAVRTEGRSGTFSILMPIRVPEAV